MHRHSFRRSLLFAGALAAFATLGFAEPDSKWRVEFDHWAETDGELVLRIAPLNGSPIDVSTRISKDTTENTAADLVSGALKAQLGKGYKVEVDDGEDVVIKKSSKTPKFEVSMVSSSVTGLNVNIKH